MQAVKKTGEFVPLAHGGVGVEGCVVRVEVVGGVGVGESVPTSAADEKAVASSSLLLLRDDDARGGTGTERTAGKEEEEEEEKSSRRLDEPIGMYGGVRISVRVETTAKTGVEMEALTGVVGAALTVVDMCKGVDRGCVVGGVRVVGKKGGRGGGWGIWG